MNSGTKPYLSLPKKCDFVHSSDLGELTPDLLILFGLSIVCLPDALKSRSLLSQVDAALRVVFSFFPPDFSINISRFVSVFLSSSVSQHVQDQVCRYIESSFVAFGFSRSLEIRDFRRDRFEMARAIVETEALIASGHISSVSLVARSRSEAISDMRAFDRSLGLSL